MFRLAAAAFTPMRQTFVAVNKLVCKPARRIRPSIIALNASFGAATIAFTICKPSAHCQIEREDTRAFWAQKGSRALKIRRVPTNVHVRIIAADVGGTNSRFMLYEVDPEEDIVLMKEAPGKLLCVHKYANIKFSCFSDVVSEFFKDAEAEGWISEGDRDIVAGCFAVAGVAQANKSRLTNLDWVIDGHALAKEFNIARVEIINDFVAQGYGMLTLAEDEVDQIAGPPAQPGGVIACIGAGTGLGQCFLTTGAHGQYTCFPSEGGHAEFAPRGAGNDETTINLLKFLKVKYSGWSRISTERVVSGKGICNIYEFLAHSSPKTVDREIHASYLAARHDAGIIARHAETDPICGQTLQIFADAYGCACGTYALQLMPFGGLYVTGGVSQKLATFLKNEGSFLESYFDKGRVSPLLQDIPLFFVQSDDMGQRGAHLQAVKIARLLQEGLKSPTVEEEAETDICVHLVPPRENQMARLMQESGQQQPAPDSVQARTRTKTFLPPVLGAD